MYVLRWVFGIGPGGGGRREVTYNDFLVDDMLPMRPLVNEVGRDTQDNDHTAPLQDASDELEDPDEGLREDGHGACCELTVLTLSELEV